MQEPRRKQYRKLSDFNNPLELLKSVVCKRCCQGIKLSTEKYCDDCLLEIKIKREYKLTPTLNWEMRSEESKKAVYKSRYISRLRKSLYKLNNKIRLLQGTTDNKTIDKRINKLLQKQKMLNAEYVALVSDTKFSENEQRKKEPKDEREMVIDYFKSLVGTAHKMASDELY